MTPCIESFRPIFLCVLLAGTILPLFSLAVERFFLKKASASARHRLWTLTAAGLLLFPAIVLVVRGGGNQASKERLSGPQIESVLNESPPDRYAVDLNLPGERHSIESGDFVPKNVFFEDISFPVAVADEEARPDAASSFAPGIVLTFATASWLVGVVLFLLYFMVAHFRAFLFLARLSFEKDADPVFDVFDSGAGEGIRLIFSRETAIPFAFGSLRPTIVFPVEAKQWPEEKRWAILLHEKAHIVRRDLLWQKAVRLAGIVYWFHPFAWFLNRRVRIEQERACDDMVLASGQRSSDYAGILLELSKNLSTNRLVPEGGLAMVRQKTVVKRIDSILDEKTSRTPVGRPATLGLLAGVLLLSFVASLFAPKISLPIFARDNDPQRHVAVTDETEGDEVSEAGKEPTELERLLAQNKEENETWNLHNEGKIKWTAGEQRKFLDGCIETSTKILAFSLEDKKKRQIERGRMFWIRMIAFDDLEAGKRRHEKVIAELEKTPGHEKAIDSIRFEILALEAAELMKSEDYEEKLAELKKSIFKEFETDPIRAAKRAMAMLEGVRSYGERSRMPFDERIEFYENGMKESIPEFRKSDDLNVRRKADYYEGELRFKDLVGKKLELEGILVDGKKFDWNSYRGKLVLVYFNTPQWNTDEYCSLAYFTDAFKRVDELYREEGLRFVGYGIAIPGRSDAYSDAELLKSMDIAKLPGVMISGNKSLAAGYTSMNVYYGCSFSPCVLLVDRDGTVLSTNTGHVHNNFADRNGEVELDRTLRSYFKTGTIPRYVSVEKIKAGDRVERLARFDSFRNTFREEIDRMTAPDLSGEQFADSMGDWFAKPLASESRIDEVRRTRICTDLASFIKDRLPENLSQRQRKILLDGTLRFTAFSLIGCPYNGIPEQLENLRWRIASVLREEPLTSSEQARLAEQLDFMRKFLAEFVSPNITEEENKTPEERLARFEQYVADPFCPFFKRPFSGEQWAKFLKRLERCKEYGFGSQGFQTIGILVNAVGFVDYPTKRNPGSIELNDAGPIMDFRHPGSGYFINIFGYDNDNIARRTAGDIDRPGYRPLDLEAHKAMSSSPDPTGPSLSREEAVRIVREKKIGHFLYCGTSNELVGCNRSFSSIGITK